MNKPLVYFINWVGFGTISYLMIINHAPAWQTLLAVVLSLMLVVTNYIDGYIKGEKS